MKKYFLIPLILVSIVSCKESDVQKVTYGEICPISTKAADSSETLVLNPDSLQEQLFKNNTSVLLGINSVHQAKDEVNIARANLFPSLNLQTLLYASSSATFTTSAVEIMFPFLVPGNWAKLKESKDLYQVQKYSTQAVKLNALATSLSTFLSVNSDLILKGIYKEESDDLKQVADLVDRLYQSGLASKSDVDRAQGVWNFSRVGLSKVNALVVQEVASFRHMLGVDVGQKIELTSFEIAPSEYEDKSISEVTEKAFAVAPEAQQMLAMRRAAERNAFKARFAFIGGVSMRAPGGQSGSSSIAFDNSTIGANFNIGYAQVPMVQLSQHKIEEIDIRIKELKREIAEQSEYALQLVQDGKERLVFAETAEALLLSVYQRDLAKYQFGSVDLQTVLNSRAQYREARIEALRAKIQFGLNRIVLHRLMITGEFQKVGTCL